MAVTTPPVATALYYALCKGVVAFLLIHVWSSKVKQGNLVLGVIFRVFHMNPNMTLYRIYSEMGAVWCVMPPVTRQDDGI